MFNFWWLAESSKQKMSPEMQNNEKGSLSHQKIKCSFLDYIQLLMIGWAIWAKNIDRNAKKQKGPPKSSKNKMFIFWLCSTSDDQPINPSKKFDQNAKKLKRPPKSFKNKMFIFQLRSTSDDRPSNPSKTVDQNTKKQKRPPKTSQNKMFVFGLHSTSDNQLSNLSQ